MNMSISKGADHRKGAARPVVVSEVDPTVENLYKAKVGDEIEIKHYRAALQEAKKLDPSAERSGTVTESDAATGTVGDTRAPVAGPEVRETKRLGVNQSRTSLRRRLRPPPGA